MSALPEASCAVCGFVLDIVDRDGEDVAYQHTQASADDHPVVPVNQTDIVTNFRCDFCLADHARWELPAKDYVVSPGHMNKGSWAACDPCADLLRVDDWDALIRRVAGIARGASPAILRYVYGKLRPNITGPVRLHTK